MSQAKTVKEVLVAAEWILTNVGWCQGTGYRDKEGLYIPDVWSDPNDLKRLGSCCLVGALYLVRKEKSTSYLHTTNLLRDLLPEGYGGLLEFNDDPSTTKEDVLRLIRKGIESSP